MANIKIGIQVKILDSFPLKDEILEVVRRVKTGEWRGPTKQFTAAQAASYWVVQNDVKTIGMPKE
jgi:hypothetical protein